MEDLVYLNGALVPRSESRISPFDYGFLYGFGLFETMRAYSGRVFRLRRHLERLISSAQALGLPVPLSQEHLEAAVYETLTANGLWDARLRLTISAGEGEPVPNPATCKEPTVLIIASKLAPIPESTYKTGYSAVVSSQRQNSQSPLARVKSTSYLPLLLAKAEAQKAGFQEAILLNEKGDVAEGSISNVFMVKGDTLLTPDVVSGCLLGITRATVMELAAAAGFEIVERSLRLDELLGADEAFLTNSILELAPLVGVGEEAIGSGMPGPVTKVLLRAYRELVAGEER